MKKINLLKYYSLSYIVVASFYVLEYKGSKFVKLLKEKGFLENKKKYKLYRQRRISSPITYEISYQLKYPPLFKYTVEDAENSLDFVFSNPLKEKSLCVRNY